MLAVRIRRNGRRGRRDENLMTNMMQRMKEMIHVDAKEGGQRRRTSTAAHGRTHSPANAHARTHARTRTRTRPRARGPAHLRTCAPVHPLSLWPLRISMAAMASQEHILSCSREHILSPAIFNDRNSLPWQ